MSKSKGSRRERELRNILRELEGFIPLRMPSSGSGTNQDLPDLLVGRKVGRPLAIELKSGSEDPLYVREDETKSLNRFARAFEAIPIVAARFDGDTNYYRVKLSSAPRTDGGSVRMKKAHVTEEWSCWEKSS